MCLKFEVTKSFLSYTLRIKNYTSLLKRKFCYAALQPKELPAQKLSHRLKRTNSNLSKIQGQELIFLLTYFTDSQEENESCQWFLTA